MKFVKAGRHWINLEAVASVEFVESPKKPGELKAVRVQYANGKHQDFADQAEINDIRAFLENHEAT